ncbi:coiled-coil domain-containing protein 17 isoform X2 [Dromaius novaehollandiae]|uniref:coiled-coil domain-containing protein 17 isoform X2 n=1 Tax=Dromaius novaehollandiae TaxID=8790 RepID=UPI00311EB2F8
MPGVRLFPCPGCRMRFSSRPLLLKHMERFCIGTPAVGAAPGKAAAPGASVAGARPGVGRGTLPCGEQPVSPPAGRRLPPSSRPAQPPTAVPGPAPRLQELAEAHERRMAEIRARSRQLERQREELCRRLGELAGREAVTWGSNAARAPGSLHLTALLPAAGPLAAETRALRLAYLQGGGREPAVLAQLLELQVEAAALERAAARRHRGRRAEPPAAGAGALCAELLAVELENRRLEDELLRLKVRKERRADAGSVVAQQQAAELARLQAEVGMLRHHAGRPGPPRLPPPVAPPIPLLLPPVATVRARGPRGRTRLGTTEPPVRPVAPLQAEPRLHAATGRDADAHAVLEADASTAAMYRFLPAAPHQPALGAGSATAPGCPPAPASFPLAPYVALEDPPPAPELLDQPRPSRR